MSPLLLYTDVTDSTSLLLQNVFAFQWRSAYCGRDSKCKCPGAVLQNYYFFFFSVHWDINTLQYPVAGSLRAALAIRYSTSVSSSLRVSKFHMLSHNTGFAIPSVKILLTTFLVGDFLWKHTGLIFTHSFLLLML